MVSSALRVPKVVGTRSLLCGNRELRLDRVAIMGVLNLTPDSFSDGGELLSGLSVDREALLRRADTLVAQGAALLDIGAESTRPGATPVAVDLECERIVTALELLVPRFDLVLSVDTSAPKVFAAAAAAGAGLLNDVRALKREGALAAAAATGLPICLGHMQGEPGSMQDVPCYDDVVGEVIGFLEDRLAAAQGAGIGPERLLVDPGFGFGKTLAHNCRLLRELDRFEGLGVLVVGISRKRMIGSLTGRALGERVSGSIAAAAIAVLGGAQIVRTHDVAETLDAVRVAEAIRYQQHNDKKERTYG